MKILVRYGNKAERKKVIEQQIYDWILRVEGKAAAEKHKAIKIRKDK